VRGVVAYRPIGQMTSEQDCRKRLVHTALQLFATRGYHSTSIADILRESGCTRGSLYYYFPSKEDLGYAAIDEMLRLLVEQGAASHLQGNAHPIDRLLRTLDDLPSGLRLEPSGSLVIGVTSRMATVHEGFRQRLVTGLAPLIEEIERMLRKGVADGQIVDSVDPRQLAHVAAIVGHGIQMAGLLGQREVISDDARQWMREYLNSLRK
jgi:TetR/AcrR family transcriptional repressor of nem operon